MGLATNPSIFRVLFLLLLFATKLPFCHHLPFLPKTYSVAEIAQLGERQTEDLKVPGSNPENSHKFWIIPGLGKNFFGFFFRLLNTLFGYGRRQPFGLYTFSWVISLTVVRKTPPCAKVLLAKINSAIHWKVIYPGLIALSTFRKTWGRTGGQLWP